MQPPEPGTAPTEAPPKTTRSSGLGSWDPPSAPFLPPDTPVTQRYPHGNTLGTCTTLQQVLGRQPPLPTPITTKHRSRLTVYKPARRMTRVDLPP
eukprot:363382-Chlamydomonas_euryale.AAC.4